MDRASFLAVYQLAQEWGRRTDKAERAEFKRLRIGDTGQTYDGIKSTVKQAGDGLVIIEHQFATVGRFRDMGAGPGAPGYSTGRPTVESAVAKLESRDRNKQLVREDRSKAPKGRRPKKFYSPIFYGRLNALMGVTSATMQEQAISLVQQQLTGGNNSGDPFDDPRMFM